MTTETKGVGQSHFHLTALSLVEGEVQIVVNLLVVVAVLVVDGGRNDSLLASLHAEQSLHGTCSAKHLTCH